MLFTKWKWFSVNELQQQRDLGGVRNEKPKKFDHLILGPAAGEGLPDRLQCQGCIYTISSEKSLNFSLPEFPISLVKFVYRRFHLSYNIYLHFFRM